MCEQVHDNRCVGEEKSQVVEGARVEGTQRGDLNDAACSGQHRGPGIMGTGQEEASEEAMKAEGEAAARDWTAGRQRARSNRVCSMMSLA